MKKKKSPPQQHYKNLVLYYFTGTGNALIAARWIKTVAASRGIKTSMHAIDRNYQPDPKELHEKTLIGFLYPTHGFNLAPSMLYFILKFPRLNNTAAFLVNTRAGSKIFKLLGPGLSGIAQLLPMLILSFKGLSLRGGLPLDMPSNWISLHPGYSDRWIQFIVKRCEQITKNFSRTIFNGKRQFVRPLATLPLDLAVLPIAMLYFLIGRFALAKTFIASYNCNDCLICVKNCPVAAIEIRLGKPFWKKNCESCMRCINNCPQQAIQTSHLLLAIFIALSNIPFMLYLYNTAPFLIITNNRFMLFLLDSYLSLAIIFITYWIFMFLLKIKPINVLITFTSLTRFWRRYRAPRVKLKDYRAD